MTATRAELVLVIALVCATAPVRAAEIAVVAGVRVAVPTCPIAPLSVPAFVDSLRVELASRARVAGKTLVTLEIEPCDTSTARIRVVVATDADGPVAMRDIGLEDIATEARPRALALAVAELVRSVLPPAARAPPVTGAPALPPGAPPAPTLGLAADAVVSLFPGRDTVLGGGRLTYLATGARWRVGLLGEIAAGEHDYDVGRVAVQSFGAGVVAGPRWVSGRFTVCPGLLGALGWARIQGHADTLDVASGSGAALTAVARAHIGASARLGRGLSLRGLVEGGYMLRAFAATVDGAPAAGLSGASIVIGLGLGFGG